MGSPLNAPPPLLNEPTGIGTLSRSYVCSVQHQHVNSFVFILWQGTLPQNSCYTACFLFVFFFMYVWYLWGTAWGGNVTCTFYFFWHLKGTVRDMGGEACRGKVGRGKQVWNYEKELGGPPSRPLAPSQPHSWVWGFKDIEWTLNVVSLNCFLLSLKMIRQQISEFKWIWIKAIYD